MKEAMLYEKQPDMHVRCNLCARNCLIPENKSGFCRVRKNVGGILFSLVYGRACSTQVDEIQKKPLFHYAPGTNVYSIATIGCNFRCKFCCNWVISQEKEIVGQNLPPEEVVGEAIRSGCQGISYTYTEPTIFFEYAYDSAKLAHKKGLFNTFVTNGYMTPEAVKTIAPYLDAATVDFKGGGDPEFYKNFSLVPSVEPIYECLKEMKRQNIFIEITNLVVPKIGDSLDRIHGLVQWIKDNLGTDTPLHFLRFHPHHFVTNLPPTPVKSLENAVKIADDVGMRYVYIGNVAGHPRENTYCWNCGEKVISRWSVYLVDYRLKDGKCPKCSASINIGGLKWVPEDFKK